jgi:hypothetical protein
VPVRGARDQVEALDSGPLGREVHAGLTCLPARGWLGPAYGLYLIDLLVGERRANGPVNGPVSYQERRCRETGCRAARWAPSLR